MNTISNVELSDPLCDSVNRCLTLVRLATSQTCPLLRYKIWLVKSCRICYWKFLNAIWNTKYSCKEPNKWSLKSWTWQNVFSECFVKNKYYKMPEYWPTYRTKMHPTKCTSVFLCMCIFKIIIFIQKHLTR